MACPSFMSTVRPFVARMFFGIPGRSEIKLSKGENQISFSFEAIETEARHATMHLRFGQEPGTILLDDIRVVEKGTGEK